MEKKLWVLLNTLGLTALAVVVMLGIEMWSKIRPIEIPPEFVTVNRLLEQRHNQVKKPPMPPEPKKQIRGRAETARVAAVKVLVSHIDGFMMPSFKGACGMNRQEYISAIAEALVEFAHDNEEAFWLAGMMQAESSFRLGAKPGKATNSSARGLLQVIYRWHKDVLKPVGITKELMASDISLSVQGGCLVFHKYRFPKRGPVRERTLEEATTRYRSLRASAKEHRAYQATASAVCEKLKKAYRKEVDKK